MRASELQVLKFRGEPLHLPGVHRKPEHSKDQQLLQNLPRGPAFCPYVLEFRGSWPPTLNLKVKVKASQEASVEP